jgi:hypothetical protein
MSEFQDLPDYVWHIKLSEDDEEGLHEEALIEMLRQQLKALLECVELTGNGIQVRVTGFHLLSEPDREYAIYRGTPTAKAPEGETTG